MAPSNAWAYATTKQKKTNKQKAYRHIASGWVAAVPFFACHGVAIIPVVRRSSGLNKGRVLKGKIRPFFSLMILLLRMRQ